MKKLLLNISYLVLCIVGFSSCQDNWVNVYNSQKHFNCDTFNINTSLMIVRQKRNITPNSKEFTLFENGREVGSAYSYKGGNIEDIIRYLQWYYEKYLPKIKKHPSFCD